MLMTQPLMRIHLPALERSLCCGTLTDTHAPPCVTHPQDVANLLYALAKLRYRPGTKWTRLLLTCTAPQLTEGMFSPQHLANTLWALSRLQARPGKDWLLLYAAQAQEQIRMFNFKEAQQVRADL
jgi:hypothetical protein